MLEVLFFLLLLFLLFFQTILHASTATLYLVKKKEENCFVQNQSKGVCVPYRLQYEFRIAFHMDNMFANDFIYENLCQNENQLLIRENVYWVRLH